MSTKTTSSKNASGRESLTPLMQQYNAIKQDHPGSILFFRLGDFYEMFGDDAIKASPILEIVLTRRQGVPMCGVPFHSMNSYIAKLIKKGFSIAVCEQTEEPAQARGIVRRKVVRVITPGTVLEENLLNAGRNNFLLAATSANEKSAIAYVDISTGDFYVSESTLGFGSREIRSELSKIDPGEFILPQSINDLSVLDFIKSAGKPFRTVDDWYFEPSQAEENILKNFRSSSLKSIGLEEKTAAIMACGALLKFIEENQAEVIALVRAPRFYSIDDHLIIDENAISSLEMCALTETLDCTATPMGSRILRNTLYNPLTDAVRISARLDAVEFFFTDGSARRKASESLKNICDIERILSRLSSGIAQPRELVALKNTLRKIPEVKSSLEAAPGAGAAGLPEILSAARANLVYPEETVNLIEESISDYPGADIRKGGVIKKGYNRELDELRQIASGGKSYIAEIEQRERRRTGISSLRIGYTGAFGYYIEVTKANLEKVPPDFVRKQTLVNAERFITPELKEYESKILSAEEKALHLEKELYDVIRNCILARKDILQPAAWALAEIDLYSSLAITAIERDYARPRVNSGYELKITGGRHPVVEPALKGRSFVPNDIFLDGSEHQIMILTGPNMAGKSTYLRQNALIVIMAQSGMFIPAQEAEIGIVDRIFTRVGAADNLAGGESTFMVEMRQTANILHNSSSRSLLILDEVGRGTSTFDGISIAWAVIEYLSKRPENTPGTAEALPKVLFATHYFELTGLEGRIKGVRNFNVSVKEWKGQVTFLHKIVPGSSDRSYGIHVAKLAGLPEEVIGRAYEIISMLEKKEIEIEQYGRRTDPAQIEFPPEITAELAEIDPDNMTPMEALAALHRLRERYKNEQRRREKTA